MVGWSMKTAAKKSASYTEDKRKLLVRLRRMEGQVRGIARMVEDERNRIELLQQIASLRAAADGLALNLLRSHLDGCVRDAVNSGDGDRQIDEVMEVVRRYTRS